MICVLRPAPNECFGCGEWLHAERRGGFEGPDGNRFCAEDCIESFMEACARVQSDWCPACGYDRHEHAPDCRRVLP